MLSKEALKGKGAGKAVEGPLVKQMQMIRKHWSGIYLKISR